MQHVVKQYQNAELIPAILSYIDETRTATLNLRGRSMRPFLEDGRDKAVLSLPHDVKVGDAVLAEIEPLHFVLHRVWKIEGDSVTLMGDGNLVPEHCTMKDIRAKVTAFLRKGRTVPDSTDGLKWRIYSWLWIRLYPIRRYLLALYRRMPGKEMSIFG